MSGREDFGERAPANGAGDAREAETEPIVARRVPDSFRERIRLRLPGAQREMFDELLAWEDDIVEALNVACEANDRMAEGLNACASAAGNPDAAEGCRQVIALARRALGGANQKDRDVR